MNLFFRLFKVLFLLWLRPGKLELLEESRLTFRVWPNDLDTNGHMNNGRYMTVMDLGRLDVLLRVGLGWKAFRRGWNPILAGAMIRYRKSLKLFETFDLRTRILCWDEKWVYLEQRLEHNGLVATALLKGIFRGKKGNVPMPKLLKLIPSTMPSPPIPDSIRLWQEAEAAMEANPRPNPSQA